ncbi:MAG: PQQ-binding-like beta-propeller repeat protein [Candidatus Hydrogenedentota bacterium]
MKYRIAVLMSVCVPLFAAGLPAFADAAAAWTYDAPAGYVDCSPVVADLDGNGAMDIVVGTTAGQVIALDAHGHELWRQDMQGVLNVAPTAADITSGPEPELLVLSMGGKLYCLDGATGGHIWEQSLPSDVEWGMTAVVVADLDGDGTKEVIAGDGAGHVLCFQNDGALAWSWQGDLGAVQCPATGDVTGDGATDVVVTGKEGACVLAADGTVLGSMDEGPCSSPVLANLDDDPAMEIVFAVGRDLKAYDGAGFDQRWSHKMPGVIDSGLAATDIDGDGAVDIVAVDLLGQAVCLGHAGGLKWQADVRERVRRSPTIADVDGDGAFEVLVAGYDSTLYVFNADGSLAEKVSLNGATNASPTLFTADNALHTVIPTGGGAVNAWTWPNAKADAAMPWPEYRATAARIGRVAQQDSEGAAIASVDFGPLYVGHNEFRATLDNPAEEPVVLELEAVINGGAPSVSTVESSTVTVSHVLPYQLQGDAAVNIALRCTVRVDGEQVDRRAKRAYVVPFENEFADTARHVAQLAAAVDALPDSTGMDARLALLQQRYDTLRERKDRAGALDDAARRAFRDAVHTLTDDLDRAVIIAEAALAAEAPVFIVPANPWAPFGGMDELVEGRTAQGAAAVTAFQGEIESAAFNIFNCSGAPRTFRVEPGAFAAGEDNTEENALTVREAVAVPTDMLDVVPDALPTLNQGNLLTVPAWDARQLWVTVDSAGLAPATWEGRIRLRSLEVEPLDLTAEMTAEVWPAALPEDQTLGLCTWGYVHTSVLKDQPDTALRDKVDHGVNIFVGRFFPQAEFDEAGNLTGDIDFAEHDAYVKERTGHGIILFCYYQRALRGPAKPGSDTYRKAHIAYLRAWVDHLEELGLDYSDWALYPVDEPGLKDGRVEDYLRYGKLAREADPKIQMYTDPVSRITMEELEAMAPYVDIWCPNRGGFLLDENADKLDFMKSTGATMWTYECEGYAKHQSPLGYYRGLAWLSWHHDLTGFGFWSYCTSRNDPWFKPETRLDYLLIYQGNGVVTSKRWEAVRDGIEDHAMLVALREAAEKASAAGNHADAVAEARALLDDKADVIAAFCGLDDDGTLPGAGGMPEVRRVADKRWAEIQAVRAEMAELLARLKE